MIPRLPSDSRSIEQVAQSVGQTRVDSPPEIDISPERSNTWLEYEMTERQSLPITIPHLRCLLFYVCEGVADSSGSRVDGTESN